MRVQSVIKRSRRWLTLVAGVAVLASLVAPSVLAAPTFTFVKDDQGANDEPGQKDLTAQASAFDGSTFYSAWKWDDTSWSGKNTGDGCSLFDSDGDGLVNAAVCATIGGKTPALLSVTTYTCGDTRPDRCTNPVLVRTDTTSCTISSATGSFDATDTQATCNISAIATATGLSALVGANLLNTCSYPSSEPNSDPSDCVLTVANGTLVVIKAVSNTAGGTAVASDFSYDGGGTTGLTSVTAAASPGNSVSLPSGTTFAVVENGLTSGKITKNGVTYTASYSGCTGTIASGVTATCTITNTADKASPGIGTTMKWTLNDSATLSSFRTGGTGGAVTFTLYQGDTTACTDATKIVYGPLTVNVDNSAGTASTATDGGYTTTTVGTFKWKVSYNGNTLNNPIAADCTEVTTIQ